tara:strand:- start:182 stop:445 length:264 start_codon:yes stop_codon:yes gene_type:complete
MNKEVKIEQNIPLPKGKKIKQEPIQKYKWKCISALSKLKVGESIKIEERKYYTIKAYYLWIAQGLSLGSQFVVKSIDEDTHRVWRVK